MRQSKSKASLTGRSAWISMWPSTLLDQIPNTTPMAPPIRARLTLSVTSCASNRDRRAPSAVRIAISRSRVVARTSTRLATLTQANRSTMPASERNNAAMMYMVFGSPVAMRIVGSEKAASVRFFSASGS